MRNIYYDPQDFDLEIVTTHEFSSRNYEFDTRVIWRDIHTGDLYTAREYGCSCPTPFENYTKKEDLAEVRSVQWLIEEAFEEAKKEYYAGDHISPYIEELRCLLKK